MKLLLSIISICCLTVLYSQPYLGEYSVETPDSDTRAAGCAPANASTFLEFNNVKALIHSGGNLWQIAGENRSMYEVPKGSGIMALFTSALWLGGVDVNGQLKIAAVRYRTGQDYWTGPLTTAGEAEIIPSQCTEYDRHFTITQDEVREFDAWFKAGEQDALNGTNTQAEMFPDYEIPISILDWPAHGDQSLGQDLYLAPFYDRDSDGFYDPLKGDYPWYDIEKELDCSVDRTVTLYGDQTVWWVMNDKGNIHTETGGDPLGMEIRCQAFAFATNDEVNNMTFYNYELVNRSTQTLYDTYFGVFIDGALGGPFDDYVGCDVQRGLGYTYNGNSYDATDGGWLGYGDNPPACGIDFFEGPYQDNDGVDNPLIGDYYTAKTENGIPYPGLGIGYGDGIIDNERMGMSKFLYYNNFGGGANPAQTDPLTGQDYYNYLSGYWKDGTHFVYGGNGHPGDPSANPLVEAQYMFPDDTDTLGWGTEGIPQPKWTEQTAGNVPYDRRFAQSSGPFVLKPGAVNNITVGVVWARATSGDPFESVKELQKADDKAQALFDNCFKVLDGPHAPELSIQEMENELIISIHNPTTSNNFNEAYEEFDPFIVNVDNDPDFDPFYRFQGYQVYQLKDATVSSTDLQDIEQARLVFQCDIKDSVTTLINYVYDDYVGSSVPEVMVEGTNKGIQHSFNVTEDQFATGDRKLVNFKTYYYMAVAYASNEFKEYDPNNPAQLNGQKIPYLASRKAAVGEILTFEGIPHNPTPENGGTVFSVGYGYEIPLTRIDGWGNGGNWTEISEASEAVILANGSQAELTYKAGASPVIVKVIDPLNLPSADFELYFNEDPSGNLDSSSWSLLNINTGEVIESDHTINFGNEQLIPEWGISIWVEQTEYEDGTLARSNWKTYPIDATITFADSSLQWLAGVEDDDGFYPTNWIRSGNYEPQAEECIYGEVYSPCYYPDKKLDFNKEYQQLLEGTIAPFKLVGTEFHGMPIGPPDGTYNTSTGEYNTGYFSPKGMQNAFSFADLRGVDLVITSDQSKWTKCPVLEMGWENNYTQGDATILELRDATSKDINGNEIPGDKGMSYFPGYAIDVETGERLNMAFGENSWLNGSNGTDMLWNPTDEYVDNTGNPILGGSHAIFIFGSKIGSSDMPVYDEGAFLKANLSMGTGAGYNEVFKSCMWVMQPMLAEGHELLESDLRIQVRVSHPYQEKVYTNINEGRPAYAFSTFNIYSQTNINDTQVDALSMINIVPNPYYAYNAYESNSLENKIKITNLPQTCTVKIFNMTGQLIRTLQKDNEDTYLDWDLKNLQGIPIASGVYIFHIEVPEVGEVILKWYGAMRQVDLNTF